MNIGIIIHSFTGNTKSVAETVKNTLTASGHTVTLKKIGLNTDYNPQKHNITITDAPSIDEFDAVIFGAPVEGFSLSPVMRAYLEQAGGLDGKKTAALITQYFPYAWMGGNRAAAQMKNACEKNGATFEGKAIVNWAGESRRTKKITDAVAELNGLF